MKPLFPLAKAALAIGLLCLLPAPAPAQTAPNGGGTTKPYIDAKQQTSLWFGARSHWMQPWRAYQDTPPASKLREALGINLNVGADEADAVSASGPQRVPQSPHRSWMGQFGL